MGIAERDVRRAKATASPLARATEAYAKAEYGQLLTIIAESHHADIQSDLLRARALLRLFRNADVISIFESRTRKGWGALYSMILALAGLAQIRSGEPDAGSRAMASALADVPSTTPQEMRSEIAYLGAQAAWASNDFNRAEQLATSIGRDADVMHVRSLDLLGFVASAKGDLQTASRYHSLALSHYPQCVVRDEHVYGNLVSQVMTLAVELIDPYLRQQAREHMPLVRWTKEMDRQHYIVDMYDGKLALLEGDAALAFERFESAVERADSAAHRAMVLYALADLERSLGEPFASSRLYVKANTALKGVSWSDADADQRMALVASTVSASTIGDMSGSASLVRYLSAAPPKGLPTAFNADPRTSGFEAKARGHVAMIQGKTAEANKWFEQSYNVFRRLRMRYMCIVVAAELRKLGSNSHDSELDEFKREFPHSLIVPAMSTTPEAGEQPVAVSALPSLHQAEARVYSLLCEGKSNATIAAELGKSVHTINNQTRRIYRTFNVRSKAELIAQKVAQDASSRAG